MTDEIHLTENLRIASVKALISPEELKDELSLEKATATKVLAFSKGNDEHKSIDIVNNEYEKNKRDPDQAIEKAIRWWEKLEVAPTLEDVHINE